MRGTEHATGITKTELSLKLNQEDVEDTGFMKVKAIVTVASSICSSSYWEPCRFICFLWLCGCGFELIQGRF
jgi:hypothetical protein